MILNLSYGDVCFGGVMLEQVLIPSDAVAELIAVGGFAAARGWVPATSGNFSRRLDAQTIVITRSGVDKGALGPEDFIAMRLDEAIPHGVSAEAPLHVARYRADSSIGAILHIHSVEATVLSRVECGREEIVFEGYEMQKALAGFNTHESTLRLPIFANAQDTCALAARIEERLPSSTPVPGYLLAGHGLYAWGSSIGDARRHLEALQFLLRCALEERRMNP